MSYIIRQKYTIPFIDFSDDLDRQIIVDREPGVYLGHPSTVLLEDNRTMYVVYPKGHGAGEIIIKKSTDAGITWSKRLKIPESWKDSKETPLLYRIEKIDGSKRILMVSGVPEGKGGFKTSYSDDDGNTWTEFEHNHEDLGIPYIVAFASLIRLKDSNGDWDNKWIGFFHDYEYNNYKVYLSFDKDGNMHFSKPKRFINNREIEVYAGLCEAGAFRSPDGKQIALLLRGNTKKTSSMVMFTDDEGNTWTEPVEVQGALRGERHKVAYDPVSGRLVITFRAYGVPENPDDMDWVVWIGTYDDIVNGREGQYRVRLKKNVGTVSWNGNSGDCGYAGIEVITDKNDLEYGTFILTSYGHWEPDKINHEPFIITTRFKLKEIDDYYMGRKK